MFSIVKDKKEKGESNINIFIITYLKEYENTKFNNDTVIVPFIIPSKVNILILLVSIDKFLLISLISSVKHLFFPKHIFPYASNQ